MRNGARAALLLLLTALLAGCGALGTAQDLAGTLAQDGYAQANVSLNSNNGVDVVTIVSAAHPERAGDAAFDPVGRTVWTTLPYNFDELELQIGQETGSATYDELAAGYGPRDPQLDQESIGSAVGSSLLTIGLVVLAIVVVVVVLVVLLVVWLVRRRRRRAAVPPPGAFPGPPPAGLHPQNPNQPYPPQQQYPPPQQYPPQGPPDRRPPGA